MKITPRGLGAAIVALLTARTDRGTVNANPSYYDPGQAPRPRKLIATAPSRTKIETTASGAKRALNPARREKRALVREHGVTSGRQWKRLRKQLKREARETEQGVEMGVAA